MELQCFRIMLIVFVISTFTAILAAFYITTDIPARRPKLVFKSKNVWKTPNSAEGVKWKVPSRRKVANTTIFQKHLKKENISTTDISMINTENEQENLSYSTVPTMHSASSTNSTAFSHHQDNSEHTGTIVALTVSLLVVVTVVFGSVVLCYCKKLPCFKIQAKCDLDKSSSLMLDEKDKTLDSGTTDDDDDVDEVDISPESKKSPVSIYGCTSKFSNIQPTNARENDQYQMMKL